MWADLERVDPEIAEAIGADSLAYLSVDGLIRAVGLPRENFCLACFTGDYPVPVQLEMDKLSLETMHDAGQGGAPVAEKGDSGGIGG